MEPATNDCKAAALLSRRHILARAGAGFGVVGLSGLLHSEGLLGSEARAAAGLGHRGLAAAADAGQYDIVTGGEDRHVVAGGPPAGADKAEAGFVAGTHRAFSFVEPPMYKMGQRRSSRRAEFDIAGRIADNLRSGPIFAIYTFYNDI